MEPLAAIGVAGSVIQLVDFGSKILTGRAGFFREPISQLREALEAVEDLNRLLEYSAQGHDKLKSIINAAETTVDRPVEQADRHLSEELGMSARFAIKSTFRNGNFERESTALAKLRNSPSLHVWKISNQDDLLTCVSKVAVIGYHTLRLLDTSSWIDIVSKSAPAELSNPVNVQDYWCCSLPNSMSVSREDNIKDHDGWDGMNVSGNSIAYVRGPSGKRKFKRKNRDMALGARRIRPLSACFLCFVKKLPCSNGKNCATFKKCLSPTPGQYRSLHVSPTDMMSNRDIVHAPSILASTEMLSQTKMMSLATSLNSWIFSAAGIRSIWWRVDDLSATLKCLYVTALVVGQWTVFDCDLFTQRRTLRPTTPFSGLCMVYSIVDWTLSLTKCAMLLVLLLAAFLVDLSSPESCSDKSSLTSRNVMEMPMKFQHTSATLMRCIAVSWILIQIVALCVTYCRLNHLFHPWVARNFIRTHSRRLFTLFLPGLAKLLGRNQRVSMRRRVDMPHITIKMPVYQNGLMDIILPAVEYLKTAIGMYENFDGTQAIFMNDGILLTSKDDMNSDTERKILELNNEEAPKTDTQKTSAQTLIDRVQIFDRCEHISTLVSTVQSWLVLPSRYQKSERGVSPFGSTTLSKTFKAMSAAI